MTEVWEGVALDVLEATGFERPPVDALELAGACGFDVRPGERLLRARRVGDLIEVNVKLRSVALHGAVAHELGHVALERAGEDDSEDGARYLAGALMLPRRAFDRDLRTTAWDLEELRRRHPNASAEMIARRVVQLRDGVASIWDQGRCRARVASPWLDERIAGRRSTPLERALAQRVLETGEAARPAALVSAIPVFSGHWRRVVVVVEAEQLALRWP